MRAMVESYVALAREDLAVAAKLMPDHPRHAAFNVEQAAEKLLKAVLTVEGIAFEKNHHQLGRLADLLPDDHVWKADLKAFDRFTSYATAVRYPTSGGHMPQDPEDAHVQLGWREVSSLIDEIRDWCREELEHR